MADHDDLVAKYSTPIEDLDPEARRDREETMEWFDQLEREGKYVTPEQAERQNFPIGLDDNYNPFPVRPNQRTGDEGGAEGEATSDS